MVALVQQVEMFLRVDTGEKRVGFDWKTGGNG